MKAKFVYAECKQTNINKKKRFPPVFKSFWILRVTSYPVNLAVEYLKGSRINVGSRKTSQLNEVALWYDDVSTK